MLAIIKSKKVKLEQEGKKIAKIIGKNFEDILYAWQYAKPLKHLIFSSTHLISHHLHELCYTLFYRIEAWKN